MNIQTDRHSSHTTHLHGIVRLAPTRKQWYEVWVRIPLSVGMGYILYIVISRAHNNHIVVGLQLLSCHYHIINGVPFLLYWILNFARFNLPSTRVQVMEVVGGVCVTSQSLRA